MTLDEKMVLLSNYMATPHTKADEAKVAPGARYGSAGFVPGIPRLGIPPQWQADGPTGVAEQGERGRRTGRTAIPGTISVAATWNPELAYRAGQMIGSEARDSGINVMLAGGINLMREPRGGRNFEYGGEDPLLAGDIIGSLVKGVQSNHIIATVKHYAFNAQETGRNILSADIDPAAARMSDLLAFQIAIEKSGAGSVMCAYNRVNGDFSCGNDWLLNKVLKRDWRYPGYVIADWGGVHRVSDAVNGTDQSTGVSADLFRDKLQQAMARGEVPQARIDDMARRILRSMFAVGLFEHPVGDPAPIDFVRNAAVSQRVAEQGIVLLKNTGDVLPLGKPRSIAVIGAHADLGVMSGGGSGTVWPVGGNPYPVPRVLAFPGYPTYQPSSPLKAIQAAAPGATVAYAGGDDVDEAVRLAKSSDAVVVFGTQWTSEMVDRQDLQLDAGQDALIAAVAAANPKTVVVLETGGPVLMPWLDQISAVVEAWYPGANGGKAIADVLFGTVNPSGRLPVSFAASLDQLPRPKLDGPSGSGSDLRGAALNPFGVTSFSVKYSEGAAVGYKWYDLKGLKPVFPFGHGLSYTTFEHDGLTVRPAGAGLRVSLTARNTGKRAGRDVVQVYVASVDGGWESPKRLGGFASLELAPGGQGRAEVRIDPRLLAVYDESGRVWRIAKGQYRIMAGTSSDDLPLSATITLADRTIDDAAALGSVK